MDSELSIKLRRINPPSPATKTTQNSAAVRHAMTADQQPGSIGVDLAKVLAYDGLRVLGFNGLV
jgi:hypothetical protein